jgi:hypothetical protein
MSRLAELDATNRERALTDAEVRALLRLIRPTPPSRSAEGQRAWREKRKNGINRRIRERYASDPAYREHRLAMMKAAYRRRKERPCE